MPTLTRLAALLLFGSVAFYLSQKYQLLVEYLDINPLQDYLMAFLSAMIGWSYVGKHIDKSFVRAASIVIQGSFLSLVSMYLITGLSILLVQPMQGNYRGFEQTMARLTTGLQESLMAMLDLEFLMLVISSLLAVSVVLAIVFRIAEARRIAR